MGIFGGGYTKPGRGVDKNEPKKKGVFLFFDILIHKFGKLIGANCLYAAVSILWIAALFFFGGMIFVNLGIVDIVAKSLSSAAAGIDAEQVQGSVLIALQIMFAVSVFVLWGSGPASAAYAYVNRCFTRGEPVWVASDAMDKFKENFKQGMIVLLIDALLLLFGINAISFYYGFYLAQGNVMWLMLTYITVLALVVYTMMHPYLYQIMVTFKCSIGALYKNAFIITMAKLPGNLFTTAVSVIVLALLFSFINPLAAALVVFVAGLCVTRYVTEFYAARVIERSILRDMQEKQPKIEYIDDTEKDTVSEDEEE